VRAAGLAVVEIQLVDQAVELALADEAVVERLRGESAARQTVRLRVRHDPRVLAAAAGHAEALHALVVRREALAEQVRERLDPERVYYVGGRPRPVPPDLIRDHLAPWLRMATTGAVVGLWARASAGGATGRVLFRSALVLVALPAVVAACVATVIVAGTGPAMLALAVIVVGLSAAVGVGLVQRERHRRAAQQHPSFAEWLARRSGGAYEARMELAVDLDPDHRRAVVDEQAAWHAAAVALAQAHVLPAVIAVLEDVRERERHGPGPAALGPGGGELLGELRARPPTVAAPRRCRAR